MRDDDADMTAQAVPAAREVGPPGPPGVHAALAVLEAVADGRPRTLAELARELDLPKSTLHRVVAVLVDRGWLARDASGGGFGLGIRALGLGAAGAELPFAVAFRGAAAELLRRFDETVCLAVLDGDASVFVHKEETSQPVRLVTHVGSRTPAYAAASGRVFLADWRPESVVAEYGSRPLITPTGMRLTLDELLVALAEVRAAGHAENHGETAEGLWACAFPVRNAAGIVLAALTLCVPTCRAAAERRAAMVEAGAAVARRLSADVAWMPSYDARASAPGGGGS